MRQNKAVKWRNSTIAKSIMSRLAAAGAPLLIVEAVARLPEGGSIEAIARELGDSLPRRTLQRRLAKLVEQGRLEAHGDTRGRRYTIAAVPERSDQTEGSGTSPEPALSLSRPAERLRRSVRAPIHLRKPVGYNRPFLDSYRPNETEYLPVEVKRHLGKTGRVAETALPAGTYARQILNRLLIDLSWNSSRLEGNTYSLLETERLLEWGEIAEGKAANEAQMILNHKAAIELLVNDATVIGFNRYTILNVHAVLADNLLPDPGAGGRLRSIPVSIGGTVFHPLEVPQMIAECFDLILEKATAIVDPFEQAFFVMVHLPYLQPFEDVNKRVSRLAANIPLIRLNLCPLSFVDVPNRDYIDGLLSVYELNHIELLRDVFVWAYERSCARYASIRQSLGEPDPFRLRYRKALADLIGAVVRQALNKKAALASIRQEAQAVPAEDRARFIEVAETELRGLHEGNFARYKIRPSEFDAWRNVWH